MRFASCLILIAACCAAGAAEGDRPFLHRLFSDHVVLQRDLKLPIWGWTEPGKQVTVAIGGVSANATSDADGRWQATIGPFPAGGPHVIAVSGPQQATVNDVLFGDVWICSGQSNMEMGVSL